jgi:hypothetical protein
MRKRTDTNQSRIVKILRQCGVWVYILSDQGRGFPDLLCWFRGVLFLLEVKDGEKATFTPAQHKFYDEFPGKVYVIRHEEEVQEILKKVTDARAEDKKLQGQ